MTRTSKRKDAADTAEYFLRLIVQGTVDGQLTPSQMEELHQAVYDEFGAMARDGYVSEDAVGNNSHFSYILLKNGDFISAMDQSQTRLRERIGWMTHIDVRIEGAYVTRDELEGMELYTQDIDLTSLFELREQVKENKEGDE